jgi:hypothetical protein
LVGEKRAKGFDPLLSEIKSKLCEGEEIKERKKPPG